MRSSGVSGCALVTRASLRALAITSSAEVAGESVILVRDQAAPSAHSITSAVTAAPGSAKSAAGHSADHSMPVSRLDLCARWPAASARRTWIAWKDFTKRITRWAQSRLGIWEGFIFVNLAEEPPPLDEVFAPLAGKFTHWNLPHLRSGRRIEYDVRANWKLIFENYSECYHCPGVHPMLSRVSPYDSAENDLTAGPFLGGFMKISKGASLTMSGQTCALPVGEISAEDHARVFYYSIFPNMLLSLHPDYVLVHQLWPEAPDRTRILCDWFFHPTAFARDDFRPDDAVEFWDVTNKQDWHVCELSQLGVASRAYRPGPYSTRESIPAAWDREYLRHVREEGV